MATKQEYTVALYELDSKFQQVLNSGNDESIWKYDKNKNEGYPILNWQL